MTEYTCNDCKYYYKTDEYCTHVFYKKFKPSMEACDFFKQGVFKDRFYIRAEPLVFSTGQYYVLVDLEKELIDSDGVFLSFRYSDDAETLCSFLNKTYQRLHKLQLWINEEYYENSIEKEYLRQHNHEVKE